MCFLIRIRGLYRIFDYLAKEMLKLYSCNNFIFIFLTCNKWYNLLLNYQLVSSISITYAASSKVKFT